MLPFFTAFPPDPLYAQTQASAYDELWQFAKLHDNEENTELQSVLLSGRFHYEHATVHGNDQAHHEWNVRRMRLGVKSEFVHQFTLHVEAEFNPQERDPFYKRLTSTYVEWSRSPSLAVTVGKQGVMFTMDGSTSSTELLTIDRSNLSNNMWFPQEYMPGVSVSGETSNWVYHLGAYSAGDRNREFGRLNGGLVTLAVLGYNAAEAMGVDQALVSFNYVYQNPNTNNTFTRQLEHVTSVNFRLEDGRWGVRTDVSMASGYQGQSDLWGTMIMPFLSVTDKLQVVGRHTYLRGGHNGVRLARYDKYLTGVQGDLYKEFYLGANYYFYGHNLKLQSGVQFADMSDSANDGGIYSGVAATTGLRVSW